MAFFRSKTRFTGSAGFTLVELLVVIGIIAVLISILLPALGMARDQAQRAACSSNLHQIGLTALMYANDSQGHVPYDLTGDACVVYAVPGVGGGDNRVLWQPYVKDASIFYCPGASDGLFPNSVNYVAGPSAPNQSVGWNVLPLNATLTPTEAVGTSYELLAVCNRPATSDPYNGHLPNRVHVLLTMYQPIANVASFGENSPELPDRIDEAVNPTELPFAADYVRSLSSTTNGPGNLVNLANDPFIARNNNVSSPEFTEVESHMRSGFRGMNVLFYDGHVEWRTNTEAGPRLGFNITNSYPPSDYGYTYWF